MRPRDWPTKDLFYQHLNQGLERLFGKEQLISTQGHTRRYVELSKIIADYDGNYNNEESKKISTAGYAIQELPIEILQKFKEGEQIFDNLLDINEYK